MDWIGGEFEFVELFFVFLRSIFLIFLHFSAPIFLSFFFSLRSRASILASTYLESMPTGTVVVRHAKTEEAKK